MDRQHEGRGDGVRLSEGGEVRRRALLARLEREAVRRGARRRAMLVGGPAVALALGVLAARTAWVGWPGVGPSTGGRGGEPEMALNGGTAGEAGTSVLPESVVRATEGPGAERDGTPAGSSLAAVIDVVPRVRRTVGMTIVRSNADGGIVRRVGTTDERAIGSASDERLAGALRAAGIEAGVVRTAEGVRIVADRPPAGETGSAG